MAHIADFRRACRIGWIILPLLGGGGPLAAQAPSPEILLEMARDALAQHRLADAGHILLAVPPERVDPNDLDFLRGQLALQEEDFSKAIELFHRILVRDPSLHRVRLDLALAYFLSGDDEAASHHFQIASAAGLPPEAQAKVDGYLLAIRRRRHWTGEISLGVAPDSNINAATVVKTVNLFGVPFQVDQNAKKTSGVGLAGSMAGAYQWESSEDSRLMVGGTLSDIQFADHLFNDRAVSGFAGPRFLIGEDAEISVKATAFRRWYGGEAYSRGGGGRLEGLLGLSPRWQWNASLEIQQIDYDQLNLNNGPVAILGTGLTYGIDASSFVRFGSAIEREQTNEPAFRDNQIMFETSYYRELPWGFTATLGASIDIAAYDHALSAFGVTRHDLTANYQIGMANMAVDLAGFTPVIALIHTNRYSDIAFYSFDRDRAELTFKRNF